MRVSNFEIDNGSVDIDIHYTTGDAGSSGVLHQNRHLDMEAMISSSQNIWKNGSKI